MVSGYLLVGKAAREDYSRGVREYARKHGVEVENDNVRLVEPGGALVLEAVYSPEKKGFVAVSPYREELVEFASGLGDGLEKAGVFERRDIEQALEDGLLGEREATILQTAYTAALESMKRNAALKLFRQKLAEYNRMIEEAVRSGEENADLAQKEYDRLLSNLSMMTVLDSYDM